MFRIHCQWSLLLSRRCACLVQIGAPPQQFETRATLVSCEFRGEPVVSRNTRKAVFKICAFNCVTPTIKPLGRRPRHSADAWRNPQTWWGDPSITSSRRSTLDWATGLCPLLPWWTCSLRWLCFWSVSTRSCLLKREAVGCFRW